MKLFFPNPRPVRNSHYFENSGFRWIAQEWHRRGLLEMERSDNPFVWLNKPGDVMLYDRPTLEWLSEQLDYRIGLFGNPDPPLNGKINLPWTVFPRRPDIMETYRKLKPLNHDSRGIRCVFMGGYENKIQRAFRNLNYWKPSCDVFSAFGSVAKARQQFTANEYVRVLRQARYGLCLRGYGMKCAREVECMGLGTVPILTPGVSVNYHEKLRLGVHYLFASSREEVTDLIREISREQWAEMSEAGTAWYDRNCTPLGSFENTTKIVSKL